MGIKTRHAILERSIGAAVLCAAAILGVAFLVSAAEQYPTKPIRLIVPFTPGGGTDYVGRFIAQRLTEALGQMVIVENRSGAGSTIGVEAGRNAAPDGYTITMISATYATNPLIYNTDIFFSGAPPALPQIEAGKLRPIAVTSSKRMKALPNVPTIAESGMPGYQVMHWYGLIGPKGLPHPIVDRLNMAVNKVMQRNETVEKLQNDGMSPAGGTPEEFKAMIDTVIKAWKAIAPGDLSIK